MKALFCQVCGDIVAPFREVRKPRYCRCEMHAVWWEDAAKGIVRVCDTQGHEQLVVTRNGRPLGAPQAFLLGFTNLWLSMPGTLEASDYADIVAAHEPSYLFAKMKSVAVRFRPGETGDSDWSRLPGTEPKPAPPPVDRANVTLTDGSPVPEDGSHTAPKENGQQQGYVVLSDEERSKGFVRPVRDSYKHVGVRPTFETRPLTAEETERFSNAYVAFEPYPEGHKGSAKGRFWTQAQLDSGCGQVTTMGRSIAETYAREPTFYGGTFCTTCGDHFPVGAAGEFVWAGTDERVGT